MNKKQKNKLKKQAEEYCKVMRDFFTITKEGEGIENLSEEEQIQEQIRLMKKHEHTITIIVDDK